MYYYGRRYYLPEIGRWLNRDPLGERGGLNLYGIVLNNPVNLWDVLGLNIYSKLCPNKCGEENIAEIEEIEDMIFPGMYDNPYDYAASQERRDAFNTVSKIASVANAIEAGYGAAKSFIHGLYVAAVTKIGGDMTYSETDAVNDLLDNINQVGARNGWKLFTRIEYKICKKEKCLGCFRLDWEDQPLTDWRRCHTGEKKYLGNIITGYSSFEVAEQYKQSCKQEHFMKLLFALRMKGISVKNVSLP